MRLHCKLILMGMSFRASVTDEMPVRLAERGKAEGSRQKAEGRKQWADKCRQPFSVYCLLLGRTRLGKSKIFADIHPLY